MSVTYTATLSVRDETVLSVSSLLHAERLRRGTRKNRRALGCYRHAVLVLRWFLDGTRMLQLARDNAIGTSTAYEYLHEAIGVLAARAPKLESALLASIFKRPGQRLSQGALNCRSSRPARIRRGRTCWSTR
jgi:hypothetical protein